MVTFHPFPRLPLELRIQIWQFTLIQGRIVKVRKYRNNKYYSSHTPAPAVTRVCQESRKYCTYQKLFTNTASSQYIWANFENDIMQMESTLMKEIAKDDNPERNGIRHLRLQLEDDIYGFDMSEFFFHDHQYKIRYFPNLRSCDVWVIDGLSNWVEVVMIGYWGSLPTKNIRIVDAKTGEWIDAESAGPIVSDWWNEEEDGEERFKALMKIKDGLPRVDLDE
ncbi:hypothetical protein CC86DRAFT_360760 [Ophiobolus disseminans]|uniref:2EXR domain-containing protein n=1 Tax=Ophiobolus disseminans TaxID=1469910 RepID=A0A6A6ZGS2_9PLEO|nr:hypothetical protein CC86DRAFT_360760 [Ophiobolus disseminans]